MWQPADRYALPSQEDRVHARNAIQQLERSLEVASRHRPVLDLHIRYILRELDQRRAWLAPVRLLPFELLSAVFAMAAEQVWRSPLRIACVCCLWRDVVLESPRAWSFIDIRDRPPLEITYLFFLRSGRSLLHLTVLGPPEPAEYMSLAASICIRIVCLSIRGSSKDILLEDFENLTQLSIADKSTRIPLNYLDISRFPNLRYFHGCFEKGSLVDKVAIYPGFPRIERLLVIPDSDMAWIDALRSCSKTLTGLQITVGVHDRMENVRSVDLPRLRHFQIDVVGNTHFPWSFDAKTPALRTYSVDLRSRPCAINIDVNGVTHLRCLNLVSLDPYPKLNCLHIMGHRDHQWPTLHFIDQLRRDHGVCVKLESIILNNWDVLDTQQITRNLRKRSTATGINLKLFPVEAPGTSWPGEIYVSVRNQLNIHRDELMEKTVWQGNGVLYALTQIEGSRTCSVQIFIPMSPTGVSIMLLLE